MKALDRYRFVLCHKLKDGAMPLYDCDGKVYCDGEQSVRKIVDSQGNAHPTDGSGNQVIDVKDDAELKTFVTICMASLGVTGPDGFSQFGMVDSNGRIFLPNGFTVPAVDGAGNPIPAGEAVLNVFDAQGNYIGSKICPAALNKCVVTGYDLVACLPITETAAVQPTDKIMTNESFRCNEEDGSISIGDNRFGVTSDLVNTIIPFGSFTVGPNTEHQELIWESPVYEFTTSCAGNVHVDGMWSLAITPEAGSITTAWQYSINGGTWRFDRGGLDGFGSEGIPVFGSGTVDNNEFVVSVDPVAVKGLNTIQYRITAFVTAAAPNTLQSETTNNGSGWGLTYPKLCCN